MAEPKRYTQPCVQRTPGTVFTAEEVPLFEDPKGKWVRYEDWARHAVYAVPPMPADPGTTTYYPEALSIVRSLPNRDDVVRRHVADALIGEIYRLTSKIKEYEPVNTYDFLSIEEWRARALRAEQKVKDLENNLSQLRADRRR